MGAFGGAAPRADHSQVPDRGSGRPELALDYPKRIPTLPNAWKRALT